MKYSTALWKSFHGVLDGKAFKREIGLNDKPRTRRENIVLPRKQRSQDAMEKYTRRYNPITMCYIVETNIPHCYFDKVFC